jgi:hypothetical protein
MELNFDPYRVEEIDPSEENLEAVLIKMFEMGWAFAAVSQASPAQPMYVVFIHRDLTANPISPS